MKTKLLFTLLLAFTIQLSLAQMSVSNNGSIVTFTFDDANDVGEWDANGNPINLYIWVDSADASNGVFNTLAGGWPGTPMTVIGTDIYEISVDLSTYYPDGTMINQIKYIFNDGLGSQSGDLLATDAGYSPYTLATPDFNEINNNIIFASNKLFGNENMIYTINVYNTVGQLVKSFNNQKLSLNNGLDLNLNKNELFIIQINSEKFSKVLKVILK